MREQQPQLRVSVECAGEVHPGHGDGGLEREAEGEREDVAGAGDDFGPAEGGVGEAVVRVEEDGGGGGGEGGPDPVEVRVVEAGA